MPEQLKTTLERIQEIKGQVLCPAAMDLALRATFGVADGIAIILENPSGVTQNYGKEAFGRVFLRQREGCKQPTLSVNTILKTEDGYTAFVSSNQIGDGTCVAKISFTVE